MGLPRVFIISDERSCRAGGVVFTIARMLNHIDVAGDVAVVVRTKASGKNVDAAALCSALLPLCRRAGALLLAHTDARLVGPLGLDGVHVPSTGLARVARLHMPRGRLLGMSRHRGDRLDDDDADYATMSPVFRPTSKPLDKRPCLGELALGRITAASSRPVIALGGIDAGNAALCMAQGAAGVAVVGAVLGAVDPQRALLSLLQVVRGTGSGKAKA